MEPLGVGTKNFISIIKHLEHYQSHLQQILKDKSLDFKEISIAIFLSVMGASIFYEILQKRLNCICKKGENKAKPNEQSCYWYQGQKTGIYEHFRSNRL